MERKLMLVSKHHYNFRHGIASPIIVDFVSFTPKGSTPRPCFKVLYGDGNTDYIAHSAVVAGEWSVEVMEPVIESEPEPEASL